MNIYLDAWDGLVSYTAKQKSIDDAKKLVENLKAKSEEFNAYKSIYDKAVREIQQDLKNLHNDFASYQKNIKTNDPMMDVLQKYASVYRDNHQYTEEAYTRKQLMDLFKLDAENEPLQLYMLSMSYYNLGYFENVKKTAMQLKEKYPENSYSESVSSLISYMPQ